MLREETAIKLQEYQKQSMPLSLEFYVREHTSELQKLSDALRMERDRVKGILNSMKDGVYIVNQHNNIEYINPAIEKEFGPVNERKCYEYFHDRTVVCPWCKNQEVFAGKSVVWEWYSFKTGKTYVLFDTPIKNGDGGISKLEIFRDVTEQKRAEETLKESEKQLRYLSSQLLTAQETERKKISKELHDELGQALMVMKLRLSFIERNLHNDQAELRNECELGLQYIDHVLKNVRRLSRNLSPSILEDLGFSSALRWLINNFTKHHDIQMQFHSMDIDGLFSQDAQIIVYRILQEALTNIGKHAHAKKVSVVINKHAGRVFFLVEDDGKGFNVEKTLKKSATERGLGLVTMFERAHMLGESINIWSHEGIGTQINFSIQTAKET